VNNVFLGPNGFDRPLPYRNVPPCAEPGMGPMFRLNGYTCARDKDGNRKAWATVGGPWHDDDWTDLSYQATVEQFDAAEAAAAKGSA
jgi:hypothetical protein